MDDSIAYFSPVSNIDMIEAVENFILIWDHKKNYESIFKQYSAKKSAKKLLKIINKI
jgi:hypothetical protein